MKDEIDQHIDHVRALTVRGGPLDTRAPTASVNNPEWFATPTVPRLGRAMLHQQLRDELLDGVSIDNRHAMVMAGPPGAGKSTLRRGPLRDELVGHVALDVDDIKRKLLEIAQADGTYESFLKPTGVRDLEAAGERFFPLELSALVHLEAVEIAVTARQQATAAGMPLLIDGVLSNADAAISDGQELETAGYRIDVVCMDASPAVSEYQIRQRWREAYEKTLVGEGDLMGGRWVPSSFAQHVLNGPGGRSLPALSAEQLARNVHAVTRYRVYTRSSIDAATMLTVDLSRSRPGGPLMDTEAAEASRAAQLPYSRRSRPAAGQDLDR